MNTYHEIGCVQIKNIHSHRRYTTWIEHRMSTTRMKNGMYNVHCYCVYTHKYWAIGINSMNVVFVWTWNFYLLILFFFFHHLHQVLIILKTNKTVRKYARTHAQQTKINTYFLHIFSMILKYDGFAYAYDILFVGEAIIILFLILMTKITITFIFETQTISSLFSKLNYFHVKC